MYRGDINKGFTLIEMMVVLAIIAIIITLSTPLSNIYRQNRVSTQVQDFISTLNVARNEAVSRAITVTMCIPDRRPVDENGQRIVDEETEEPIEIRCRPGGGTVDWSAGWIVFIDNNPDDCNIKLNEGDIILSEHNPMPDGFTMRVATHDCIKYTASGITPDSSGLWTMCDPSGDDYLKRGINISISGRAQILDSERAASLPTPITLGVCPTT